MKYLFILTLITAFSSLVFGQDSEPINEIQEVTKTQCTNFYITPPLRELASEDLLTQPNMRIGKERQKRTMVLNENVVETPDPIRQSAQGQGGGAIFSEVNIPGQNGGFPPDPSGAIGPNHYVQAVNSSWRVFDNEGGFETFPASLASLWSGSSNDGDPIVMYDKYAERWFISQFQTQTNSILIAISVTEDPTEEYYAYEFNLSGFPDYPKYSIWGDAYYMSANSFGHDAVAFEREKMIAGDATASMIAINAPSVPTGNFYSMLPADADGALPPSGTPCYFFFPGDNSWFGNSTDHIKVYEMSINWDNPNSSSFTLSQQIEVESFNANFTNSWDDIDQPDTNQKLDAIAGIFTYRAQYRRWITYNSMVLAMVVDIDGNNKAGIRWYELRQNDGGASEPGDWYVFQQGTYAPDDDLNRWIPSISMDNYGNIGMMYNIGGETMSASIAVCGRLKWDELGEMGVEETMIIEGTGAQEGGNRFGDYNHLSLSTDGETFWGTGEYINSGNRRTRIFNFKINDPLSTQEMPEDKIVRSIYQSNNNLMVDLSSLPSDDLVMVDVLDAKGALVSSQSFKPQNQTISEVISVNALSPGSYFVRIGNVNYQIVEKIILQ